RLVGRAFPNSFGRQDAGSTLGFTGRGVATASGPTSRREGAIKSARLVRGLGIRPLNGAAVGYIGRDGIPVEEVGGGLDDVLTVGQALDLNSVLSIRQRQNGQSRRDRAVRQRQIDVVNERRITASGEVGVFGVAPFQRVQSLLDAELQGVPTDFARPSP